MKKLYKFKWDCGRMGVVDSLFIAAEEDVEKAIGAQVDFGEILGKHSNVYGTLNQTDLTVVSDDQEFIEKLEALRILPTGHCPLHNLSEDDE